MVYIFALLLAPFASKLAYYHRRSESFGKILKWATFPSKTAICRFANMQRLTVPRMIGQFGRKRCQKKRKDMDYKILLEFFKNTLLCLNGWLSKNFYVRYALDVFFLVESVGLTKKWLYMKLWFPLFKFHHVFSWLFLSNNWG